MFGIFIVNAHMKNFMYFISHVILNIHEISKMSVTRNVLVIYLFLRKIFIYEISCIYKNHIILVDRRHKKQTIG